MYSTISCVDARLKQRCINVVPTLCNVASTLFQRRALTLYQCCATLKIRRRNFFHFQRRINFISTLIYNVETTLTRLWNVGWDLPWKILTNLHLGGLNFCVSLIYLFRLNQNLSNKGIKQTINSRRILLIGYWRIVQ